MPYKQLNIDWAYLACDGLFDVASACRCVSNRAAPDHHELTAVPWFDPFVGDAADHGPFSPVDPILRIFYV